MAFKTVAVDYYETNEGRGAYAIEGIELDWRKSRDELEVHLIVLDWNDETRCWMATDEIKTITLKEFTDGYKPCGTTYLY